MRYHALACELGFKLEDRPLFFERLLPRLQELRAQTGRPHWIVVDEAHHLLPRGWRPAALTLPLRIDNLLAITVHPDHLSQAVLHSIDIVMLLGEAPRETLSAFARAVRKREPRGCPASLPAQVRRGGTGP
jgi:hypothetical protein